MNTKKQEAIVVERLLSVLEEVRGRLGELHPPDVISLLRSRVVSTLATLRYYDLLDCVLLLGFVRDEYDQYFEHRIRLVIGGELEKTSIQPSVASMLKREFSGLSVDDHFDSDYILQFDKLEKDLTTLSQIKNILSEEEYRNVQVEIMACIASAEEVILADLQQYNQDFVKEAEKELTEKQTVQAFETSVRNLVREMHNRVLGWP